MKIIHCITLSILGGAQSVIVNLANKQAEDNEVYIISSADQTAWISLSKKIHIISIKELKREISILDIIVFLKLVYYRFIIKPDIVHLHSSKIGVLGRLAFSPFRTIYTVHGFDSIRIANKPFVKLERILQFWCRYIVGVCKYDKMTMKEEKITRNVTYVYNGIEDLTTINVIPDGQIVSSLQSIKTKYNKVILCIARESRQKKIDLFIETAKALPMYAFVWIGNDPFRKNEENVFWLGSVENAFLYLKYCDLFILPSNYEGLPMSIIEAFSFSKPVVASDVGGISELLDGRNGLCASNSVEDFSEKIRHFLSNEETLASAGAHARQTYLSFFTASEMFNNYSKLYETICPPKN